MRQLRITGESSMNVPTDFVRVSFEMEATDNKYENSINKMNIEFDKIVGIVLNCGFEKKQLKTKNYQTIKMTEYRKSIEKHVFIGFSTRQTTFIELKKDNKVVNELISKIVSSGFSTDFRIDFFCSNPGDYENTLVELAVKNAISKAEIIEKASGVKVGSITDIDYSYIEIHIEPVMETNYDKSSFAEESVNMPEFEVEDTLLKKSIRISWELK